MFNTVIIINIAEAAVVQVEGVFCVEFIMLSCTECPHEGAGFVYCVVYHNKVSVRVLLLGKFWLAG
jgi:hypothetical protein